MATQLFNKNQFNQPGAAMQPGQQPPGTQSPGAPSPSLGSTQPQPGVQQGSQQAPRSGGFTNVQNFVQANQPGQLGRGIQQQGQQAAQRAQQEVQQGQEQLQEGASMARQAQQEALQRLQTAQQGGDLQELQRQFQGLQGMQTDAGVQNRQGIVSAARRAQQVAQLSGTEGGQAALLRAQYGQQGLTQGGLGLDQMLLGSSGQDLSDLRRMSSQAARSVEDLMTQESATQQALSTDLAQVKGEGLAGLQGELDTKVAGVGQQRANLNQTLQSIQSKLTKNLTPNSWGNLPTAQEVLGRLTPEERQVFSQYAGDNLQLLGGRNDMTNQLRQLGQSIGQVSEQDQLKLMSPEQRARAEVLARLSQRGDLAEQVQNIGTQQVSGIVGQVDTAAARDSIQSRVTAAQARDQERRAQESQALNQADQQRIQAGQRIQDLQTQRASGGVITQQQRAAIDAQIAEAQAAYNAANAAFSDIIATNRRNQEVRQNEILGQQGLLNNNFDILEFLRR
jgi:hypothetical protein